MAPSDAPAEVTRSFPWQGGGEVEPLLHREWLATNGLGGYASGTVAGVATRRYHGILVSALPAPHGRTMMLSRLSEEARVEGGAMLRLGGEERRGSLPEVPGAQRLREFRLELGLPVWRYELGPGVVLKKTLFLSHGQNTARVLYQVEGNARVRLRVRPALHFRSHDAPVSAPLGGPYVLRAIDTRYEISGAGELPPLRLLMEAHGAALILEPRLSEELVFRVEESRGYGHVGQVWSPGYFRVDLAPGEHAALVASTEGWAQIESLSAEEALAAERDRRQRLLEAAHPLARSGPAAELVLASDSFLVSPAGRVQDAARAQALGDEVRSVIAGYHWFTDWGRDTMISLEGLTLRTGRHREAGQVLRTFGHHVRDGLIPNLFPEGDNEGLYHTADATLWMFHALSRYLEATGDRHTLRQLLPVLREIVAKHLQGTRFGIGVDPADGLLRQGAPGFQLTWMDAKVGDWVVTPRRGKAVEINALWYNALRLLEGWTREEGDPGAARALAGHAERARASFNRRFWYEAGGHLYDVVDGESGDDPALRPNQIFAVSLPNAVLEPSRWRAVVDVVERELVTPAGLRSLSRGHPDYKPSYHGDLRTRDAAYHQGTVWSWLIGPFVDAWIRVHPEERAGAARFLEGLVANLGDACLGSVSEIFDAEPPYAARGCVAQAWGVAELLRALLLTSGVPAARAPHQMDAAAQPGAAPVPASSARSMPA
jgi:predicted glycogen debranching enzyme